MGTSYYFARPDNRTLFDMEKAYGLIDRLGVGPISLEAIEPAIEAWFCEWPHQEPDEAKNAAHRIAAWIDQFADGQPIYLVSEHHPWIDGDDYRDGGWLRIVADRFDGFDTKCYLARFWREKTCGNV